MAEGPDGTVVERPSAGAAVDVSELQRATERTRERMTMHLNALERRVGTFLGGDVRGLPERGHGVASPPEQGRSLVRTVLAAAVRLQQAKSLARAGLPVLRSHKALAAIAGLSALVVALRIHRARRQIGS